MSWSLREIPNERNFVGWVFQKTFDYQNLIYKYRIRIVKRDDLNGIEVDFCRILKLPSIYWRNVEKFGTFYKIMKNLGIVNSPIVVKFITFENLDRIYVLKRWGIDVRGTKEIRDEKLNNLLN